ncbi:PepSY-like domain-containing protein [Gemmata sp. G18]|uniref:PepSY-like domain-containing protein n=1 Tax=Gemmata palustris TaxID=2822762 RepID=A0ABS5BQ45_9BACT|nr:PepSY-like domain-containing protein [Gemmata palustris]MBP3955851.1 PepSY-like domain-containing protein [Gemmata palustris]
MRYLAAATVVAFVLAAPVRADEEKVPLEKVPKAVLEAAKKRFPKAEVVGASKETEKDKTVYEVELKEAGKTIDVTLTPEGIITTIEKQIDAKELPKAVTDALEKKYAKATFKVVESVYSVKDGKEALDYYEVLLVTAEKKEIEVEILADGKIKHEEEKKSEK